MSIRKEIIGDATLYLGDCLEVGPTLVENAAMCFTDPPYNAAYEGAAGKIVNDNLGADFYDFLLGACRMICDKTDGAVYICMTTRELAALQQAWIGVGGHVSNIIIWDKERFTISGADYHFQYEPILYGWPKGKGRKWYGGEGEKDSWQGRGARSQSNVWRVRRPTKNKIHPTMKPEALIKIAIQNSSAPGDLVFDPFAGSGSTARAALSLGRRFVGIEIDPIYFNAACDAIHEHVMQPSLLGE